MKTLVITPTYNEKDNISKFIEAVLVVAPVDLLIVDDSSPDGTGEIVRKLAKTNPRIHLLSRQEKQGLGAAYKAGFTWALEHNYQYMVSMDADFSHRPEDLKPLLNAPESVDVVVGSRYIPGGKIIGWDVKRQINSRGANFVTRLMLGLKIHDATSGFKRYSRKFLSEVSKHRIIASGYAFQVEMILFAAQNKFLITEVPITFVDRTVGESKISGELRRSAKIVWQLFIKRRGVRQLVKFMLVGAFNAILDWTIFYLLKIPLKGSGQQGKQLAKAGSFVVSASSSYIMNRTWTFRSTDRRVAHQATKFFIIALIGLLFNNLIFFFVTSPRYLGYPDLLGLIIATAVVMFWNFALNKIWTFK